MNWYKIFYWISVADGVSTFCQTIAIILTVATCICTIGLFTSASNAAAEKSAHGEEDRDYKLWNYWTKVWKRTVTLTLPFALIFGLLTVFIPTKKDALIIVAGGAVGNFITKDTSARQIPSEVMQLLREKIAAEIRETKLSDVVNTDTLAGKTREELVEIIKNNKK